MESNGCLSVVLFCGGRGAISIIRELLRNRDIKLSLLVNAYDDGFSTGLLRDAIPGMLGPSDFRKNLSELIGLYSLQQVALRKMTEYRLSKNFLDAELSDLKLFASGSSDNFKTDFGKKIIFSLDKKKQLSISSSLARIFEYLEINKIELDFVDCSVGNLIFAGIYLEEGCNFNLASSEMSKILDATARIINVGSGTGSVLVGLLEDGTYLDKESDIVNLKYLSPISKVYLLNPKISKRAASILCGMSYSEKREWLNNNSSIPKISMAAANALAEADIIIYGPGTQHSSLLPSYLVTHEAIKVSPAKVKVMLANLDYDNDIIGLKSSDLVNNSLFYLGDVGNNNVITDLLIDKSSAKHSFENVLVDDFDQKQNYKNIAIRRLSLRSHLNHNQHCGYETVKKIRNLWKIAERGSKNPRIYIYVDMLRRSVLREQLINEILELDWLSRYSRVRIYFNFSKINIIHAVPKGIEVVYNTTKYSFSESECLAEFMKEKWDYFVSLTGDGQYRISEINKLIDYVQDKNVGLVLGTRAQSRSQLSKSLGLAYGDSTIVRSLSRIGTVMVWFLFLLRHRSILSDPLTGFRIYCRQGINAETQAKLSKNTLKKCNAIDIIIRDGVEYCELPITYLTFSGFTDLKWRIKKGFSNLRSLVSLW